MSTTEKFANEDIVKGNPCFNRFRSVVETAFYGNNVKRIETIQQAYDLASNSPGTIITDHEIKEPEKVGLKQGSKILLFNDGRIVQRVPSVRRNINDDLFNGDHYAGEIREVICNERKKKLYHATAYVGTHRDFMVKAHLLIPEGWENILYNWLLNFQIVDDKSNAVYENSLKLKNEGDIYLLAFPDWAGEEFPEGLALYDGEGNSGAILGTKVFTEYKKGTLSLAWAIAERNNYIPVHGGQKKVHISKEQEKTLLFIGLTGSGKSVLMNHLHRDNFEEEVLHDDALIISADNGKGISLERGYFNRTKDSSFQSSDNEYAISAQNHGVTMNHEGKKYLIAEDLRNENGRVILSEEAYKNRVYEMETPPEAIFWLIKDPVLPPVIKLTCPELSVAFGGTLGNIKINKTDSDLLKETEPLNIQPFGNPFRTYPVANDYYRFRKLIFERNIELYVLNTGFFMGREIPKEVTFSIVDNIVAGEDRFAPWERFSGIEIMEIMGYKADFSDVNYKSYFISRIRERIGFLQKQEEGKNEFAIFPKKAIEALEKMLAEIE